ncbi:phosphomevalonate kinase [Microbacterium imperiale]|uniref:phosphomevalonate kinase n=1 Tax=Microbacterium imperiale TaxID=33884 RepID=A0A9W6HFS1_9MICO|nr:phosphomevalonate kinase [Microbacterium imperiale]MBP2419351.1 phosphomevalonate kinase [Microbacterium imperiale]MDS0198779.1 phosphomevalonate kinase [Microbacterium imperiale]BFE39693.1 phosphomevalonate kinase [Microbacterium imperiale]GLJ79331.1 phosphomevalonate kinase [Microbacterium imperiale]
MTSTEPSGAIVVRAPGKLFVAGEYAVVSPGEPSVLIAVDRYLTVSLTESVDAGSIHSPEYSRMPVRWTRGQDGLTLDREHHPYDYVIAAIEASERLRAERGLHPRFFDLHIESGLDDPSGRKFGLGSSAAVTVATIAAIDEFYGFELGTRGRYELAMLATIAVAPNASGGDVAASTYGGWIGYRSPDRDRLRAARSAHGVAAVLGSDAWNGSEIIRLAPPVGLELLVGWTGHPASTERLVSGVSRGTNVTGDAHAGFLEASRDCVEDLWRALAVLPDAGAPGDAGSDGTLALDAIRRNRRLLQALGERTGVTIETERLRILCDAAEAIGAAGKPSGAGGGDCGIVLAPADADVAGLLRVWETNDIRHLTIGVHPPEGDNHGG